MADGLRVWCGHKGRGSASHHLDAKSGQDPGVRRQKGRWWPRRFPLAVWLGWCRKLGLRCHPLWVLAPPVAMEILTKW